MNRALILGVAGQDGSYLSQLLLGRGYQVIGTEKAFLGDLWRFKHLKIEGNENLLLQECDIADEAACAELLKKYQPDEIYNLAAQSSVALSFKEPQMTVESTAVGASVLFEAVRKHSPHSRLFQASSADMFGVCNGEEFKTEQSSFHPQSPYAVSKVFAHQMAQCYRASYGLHFSCGILFNHESALRTDAFVTMKIAKTAAAIAKGSDAVLELGNMNAKRDWGYAPEYIQAMYKMVNADMADDYIIATGHLVTVRDFVECCFKAVDMEIAWSGCGVDEKGCSKSDGRLLVAVNPEFFRPIETEPYGGSPAKIYNDLGWKAGTGLKDLCKAMVVSQL